MRDCLAKRVGLVRIASGRFSPLRGALRASKTLTRFVEQGSHPEPSAGNRKTRPQGPRFVFLAERVGFEPTVRVNRTPDFESGPFDHSGTSPDGGRILPNFHYPILASSSRTRTRVVLRPSSP